MGNPLKWLAIGATLTLSSCLLAWDLHSTCQEWCGFDALANGSLDQHLPDGWELMSDSYTTRCSEGGSWCGAPEVGVHNVASDYVESGISCDTICAGFEHDSAPLVCAPECWYTWEASFGRMEFIEGDLSGEQYAGAAYFEADGTGHGLITSLCGDAIGGLQPGDQIHCCCVSQDSLGYQ